jgi:uncharacterized protein YndB with AHSA1/START domain
MTAAKPDPAREISHSRRFAAPRALVFRMFTEPEHIARWWGPNGFRLTIHEMDVRPGGHWRFVMHGPDGTDYPNHNQYREVVPPERLVISHVSEPRHETTVVFTTLGAAETEVSFRMVFPTAALREAVARQYKAVEGLQQTLARLAELIGTVSR